MFLYQWVGPGLGCEVIILAISARTWNESLTNSKNVLGVSKELKSAILMMVLITVITPLTRDIAELGLRNQNASYTFLDSDFAGPVTQLDNFSKCDSDERRSKFMIFWSSDNHTVITVLCTAMAGTIAQLRQL